MKKQKPTCTIDRIVGMKLNCHGKAYYLVKWLGYRHEDNTWEPIEHLK
jgi:hypothetical protein